MEDHNRVWTGDVTSDVASSVIENLEHLGLLDNVSQTDEASWVLTKKGAQLIDGDETLIKVWNAQTDIKALHNRILELMD